jgi:hypothetical protein
MAAVSLLPLVPWVAAHVLRKDTSVRALRSAERWLLEDWLAQSEASGPLSPAEWTSLSATLKGMAVLRLSSELRTLEGLEPPPASSIGCPGESGPVPTAGAVLARWLERYAPLFLHAPVCAGSCRQECGGWWVE